MLQEPIVLMLNRHVMFISEAAFFRGSETWHVFTLSIFQGFMKKFSANAVETRHVYFKVF